MGFASYLEDIERVRDELLRLIRMSPDISETELLSRRRALVVQVEGIVDKVDRLLDLATDPQMSLADDLVALRKRQQEVEAIRGKLEIELANAKRKNDELNALRKEAERDAKKADAALQAVASTPEGYGRAVDFYPPPNDPIGRTR